MTLAPVMSASHSQVSRRDVDSPAKLNFVLFFVKTSTILHLERLRKQALGLGDASSEHNEAFLIVLLRRRISPNRSNVVLESAEVRGDLLDTHCANMIDCVTAGGQRCPQ